MNGYYAETKEDALQSAGVDTRRKHGRLGRLISIAEIGLKKAICEDNYRNITAVTPKSGRKRKVGGEMYDCDFFLTSANAHNGRTE